MNIGTSLANWMRRARVGPGRNRRWPATLALLLAALLAGARAQAPQDPPDEARRRNNLGVALMDAGTKDPKYFAEAVREFDGALRLAPRYATARINLALALYYAGQTARADAALRDAARQSPGERHVEYVSGLLREYEGRFDAAATHFRRVADADREDPDAWYHLGFCLGKAGRPQEAIEPLRRAAARVPYQRRIRYGLFMALSRAGRAQEAQQELERFRALDASRIRIVEGPKNALEYLKQGRYAEAIPDSRHTAPASAPVRYTDVTSAVGLPAAPRPRHPQQGGTFAADAPARATAAAAAFTDLDKDGRLDVAWVRGRAGLGLFVQRSPGRFTRVPLAVAPLAGDATALAAGDLDNDGWPDLVVGGPGRIVVLRNHQGRLRAAAGALNRVVPRTATVNALALADLDHDGDIDIVAAGGVRNRPRGRGQDPANVEAAPNLVLRNNGDGSFADVSSASGLIDTGPTRAFWFGDVDDDRAVDAVAVDVQGTAAVFLNQKDGRFARAPGLRVTGTATIAPGEARAYGDYDGDGGVDELVVDASGVRLRRNSNPPAHWITVRTAGYAQPGKVKSNTLGIGARVEVRTPGRWERREIRAGNGMGGSDAPEAVFDLGPDERLDFVRAVFPSGVRKTLADVAANQALVIEEPLLDVNSCPTLFTWNGQRFTFITDTLSAGILGELVAPGQYWSPDPDEWVRIDGTQLVPRGGTLDVRFTNPLEETTYLDQVRLLAVDHAPGVEVYSDERMLGVPEHRGPVRLYAVTARRPVASALDHHGHDVTGVLARQDRRFFDHFEPEPFKGFAGDWSLTIDVGARTSNDHPVLGLYGWSYWNSSAAIVAATQARAELWGPALDVRGADGRWRVATDDLGLPAGLPRTVLIDLAPYLRAGEHVVRIRANRTVFFDQAWVADAKWSGPLDGAAANPDVHVTEAPLAAAELRWLGYPRRTLPDGRLPEVFDYDHIEPSAEWHTASGMLTRYGAVDPLLRAIDDRFTVMGHGEEVALAFSDSALPPLRSGWRRTFFLFANGYEKGNELYSAHGETVTPLPYRTMRGYDAQTAPRPIDPRYLDYLLDWNTRPSFMRGQFVTP